MNGGWSSPLSEYTPWEIIFNGLLTKSSASIACSELRDVWGTKQDISSVMVEGVLHIRWEGSCVQSCKESFSTSLSTTLVSHAYKDIFDFFTGLGQDMIWTTLRPDEGSLSHLLEFSCFFKGSRRCHTHHALSHALTDAFQQRHLFIPLRICSGEPFLFFPRDRDAILIFFSLSAESSCQRFFPKRLVVLDRWHISP